MRGVFCGFVLLVLSAGVGAQAPSAGTPTAIPAGATSLQGSPTIRVETTVEETKRRALTPKEASAHGLRISVNGGHYFWTSHQNEELTFSTAGEFIYLSSANPGQYVRLRRINDRLTYVEHLDMGSGNVTYFGELRIVLSKP